MDSLTTRSNIPEKMFPVKSAAAYIRVSTADQAELSPESQLKVIREYADKNGYIIPEEYIYRDVGISGRSVKKRSGFNAMIAAARQKPTPFQAVLLWKFSRFARNQEESIVYKSLLRKDGIDVISVSEPIVDGPFGGLIESIIAWMDEYYSIRLSGEVKRSMEVNARKGRLQTRPAYGYVAGKKDGEGVLIPDPHETEVVREIFRRFLAGEGFLTIAKRINAMGETTQHGNPFTNEQIAKMLRNPVYIGKLRWTNDHGDVITADAKHEPIIDTETWTAVRAKLKEYKERHQYKRRNTGALKHWLSGGLLRCSSCGASLVVILRHNYQYFQCNGYLAGTCRYSQHIRAELLNDILMSKLREDLRSKERLRYELSAVSDTGEEIRRLDEGLESLDRQLDRMRKSYAVGNDTLEEYQRFKTEIEREREVIEQRKEELSARADPETAAGEIRKEIETALRTLEGGNATEEKANALRAIIEYCVWDKPRRHMEVVYHFYI